MKKLFLFLMCGFYIFLSASAQKIDSIEAIVKSAPAPVNQVQMADTFRQDGKIYVVVAVISTTLAGLFIYLFALDKKIGRIENEIKKNISGKV